MNAQPCPRPDGPLSPIRLAVPELVRPAPLPPLLVTAADAARLCGTSRPTWDRWTSAGLNPAPRRIGGRPLWSVAELQAWIEAGCPDRRRWEAMRS